VIRSKRFHTDNKLIIAGEKMSTGDKLKKDLFQTPNPTELKAKAETDPIAERENVLEADVVDRESDADGTSSRDQEIGRESAVEMSHSQVTTTNLSGH
jgi:hypothetical protein